MGGAASAFVRYELTIDQDLRRAISEQDVSEVTRVIEEIRKRELLISEIDIESDFMSGLAVVEGLDSMNRMVFLYSDYENGLEPLPLTCFQQAVLSKEGDNGLEICDILFRAGFDPDLANENGGWTALHFACVLGDFDLVKKIYDYQSTSIATPTREDVDLNFAGHRVLIREGSTPCDIVTGLMEYLMNNNRDGEDVGMSDCDEDEKKLLLNLSKIGSLLKPQEREIRKLEAKGLLANGIDDISLLV